MKLFASKSEKGVEGADQALQVAQAELELLKSFQAGQHAQIQAIAGGKNVEIKETPLEYLCETLVKKLGYEGAVVLSGASPRIMLTSCGNIFKDPAQDVKNALPLEVLGVTYAYLLVAPLQDEVILKEFVKLTTQALECTIPLQKLLEKNMQLTEVEEVKSSFIATTSHQLRTPLSVVKWVFSVLQTDAELKKLPSQMELINQAYEGIERVINSVNDILNVSRIQNGHIPYSPVSNDLKLIIKEVVGEVDALLKSRNITLTLKVAEALPNFNFDPILIKEAILNMVNNAIDYNEREKGRVGIEVIKNDSRVMITITNTGIGIKPAEQKKLFEPLFRTPEAAGLNPNGSGLALYLAQAIAREHGGSLTFTSEPGKQTSFTLTLPFK